MVRTQRVENKLITANSKPCYHCIEIMKQMGIKKVYYTISDLFTDITAWKCESLDEIHNDHISMGNRKYPK